LLQRSPELLQSVVQLAQSEDEESEGLRQAALRLLGGWHDEIQINESGDLIARWLASSRGGGASSRRRGGSNEEEEGSSASMVSIAMGAVAHRMLSVRRAAAQLFAVAAAYLARTSSPPSRLHGDEPGLLLTRLCVEVGQIVSDSTGGGAAAAAPASLPTLQAALLSPHGGPMAAALLMRQQEEIHMRRQKVELCH
jgi:hypothetical protein